VPAAVDGIITALAAQTGLGGLSSSTNFFPTWIVPTNKSDRRRNSHCRVGRFSAGSNGRQPGPADRRTFGYFNYGPMSRQSHRSNNGRHARRPIGHFTRCRPATGYDLTNIVVYGGWGDAGRDEQKYEVLYSTVAGTHDLQPSRNRGLQPTDPTGRSRHTHYADPDDVGLGQKRGCRDVQL